MGLTLTQSAESNTFNGLIDEVINRSLKSERLADIIAYARTTLRECHSLAFFAKDIVEDSYTLAASPEIWQRPDYFREMFSVGTPFYDSFGKRIFAKRVTPGPALNNVNYYYYPSGDAFVIGGLDTGVQLALAYFLYSRRFYYYTEATRPARFMTETNSWTYLTASNPTEEAAARLSVSDWLLFDWYDMIMSGTLTKLYNTVADERGRTEYSLYKSLQKDLKTSERVLSYAETIA